MNNEQFTCMAKGITIPLILGMLALASDFGFRTAGFERSNNEYNIEGDCTMIEPTNTQKLYIDHIVLTVSDIANTTEFYENVLGTPELKGKHSIMYSIGSTQLFFCLPYGQLPKGDKFSANRIGLEHLAIGVENLHDLHDIEKKLNRSAIKHSGVHIDKHSKKEKIWLDDPDGIRIEFYIR